MFIKHIGKHGDRKVAVVFRQVPEEDHMALVVYSEVLPSHMHDALMKVIESPAGQEEPELANALHRNLFPDGRVMLETLHVEGMIKKVPTSQIIMTPNASSHVRLDELNNLLNTMAKGEEALKQLAELDTNSGFVDPKIKRAAEAAYKDKQKKSAPIATPTDSLLDDSALAKNLLEQATRMEAEAKGLMAEAARIKKEADALAPKTAGTRGRKKAAVADVSQ